MKVLKFIVLGVISLLFFTNAAFAFNLIGKWERVTQPWAGMIVHAYPINNGKGLAGEIISTPSSDFPRGHLKWKNVWRKSPEIFNLEMSTSGYNEYGRRNYVRSEMRVLSNNEIFIRMFNANGLYGAEQKWVRIN